ncbi:MAG: FAD-dependent oxidoreductase, partial [Planctomycetota bacterium]|nr:FAD-dependent oxidoreductase [Planctomycetota bacterium]
MKEQGRIAIIGAGIGGLSCAQALKKQGIQVSLFDKGRRPGGRLSTRTHRLGNEEKEQFDHGAQYFSARGEDFQKDVAAWCKAGRAKVWSGRFVRGSLKADLLEEDLVRPRYVGTPAMDQVAYALAEGLEIKLETRIAKIEKTGGAIEIFDTAGRSHGRFDKVVLNMPPEQALGLLDTVTVSWEPLAKKAVMEPCWALMTVWEKRLPLN